MKKNFLWTMAALFVSGLALTGCSIEDNPNPNPLADPTVEIDFENEDASMFTIPGTRISAEIVTDETTENGTKVVKFSRSNTSGFGYATLPLMSFENAVTAEVSFDFMIPAEILGQSAICLGDTYVHNDANGGFNTSNGQYGLGVNGAIFYMGAFRGKAYGGGNENYFQINGLPAAASQEEHLAADVWGKWFHADFKVNVAEKTVSYAISNAAGETWWSGENVPFVSENAVTFTQVSIFIGNTGTYLLDNINITKTGSDAKIKYADYTVKFVDTDGEALPEDLKPVVTRRAKVGTAITLLDADKATVQTTDGSIKYVYKSDNAEGAVVTEAGTEIVVVFDKIVVPKYKYVINGYVENENYPKASDRRVFQYKGEEFEGKATSIYAPVGVFFDKDNGYYFVTPKAYNGYLISISGSEEKTDVGGEDYIVVTVNYTKDDNVVFFADCEDLEKEGEFIDGFSFGTFDRVSQGKTIRPKIGSSILTPVIAAGTYDVNIFCRSDKGEVHLDMLYVKSADGTLTKVSELPNFVEYNKMIQHEGLATLWNSGMGWLTFKNVTIPEGGSLVIKNETGEEGLAFDCIKVTKPAVE